jgi:hypothetical protein
MVPFVASYSCRTYVARDGRTGGRANRGDDDDDDDDDDTVELLLTVENGDDDELDNIADTTTNGRESICFITRELRSVFRAAVACFALLYLDPCRNSKVPIMIEITVYESSLSLSLSADTTNQPGKTMCGAVAAVKIPFSHCRCG